MASGHWDRATGSSTGRGEAGLDIVDELRPSLVSLSLPYAGVQGPRNALVITKGGTYAFNPALQGIPEQRGL